MDLCARACHSASMSGGGTFVHSPVGAITDWLVRLPGSGPSAVFLEGEAGIGKTTAWLAGTEAARGLGFLVLAARAAAAESVLAYAAIADLLNGLPASAWPPLAPPQQHAVNRVLLTGSSNDTATDQRAVGAALLSILTQLASRGPVLIAVDDWQWLDRASAQILTFAARRLTGPVAILATLRTAPATVTTAAVVELPDPKALRRITVPPLSAAALHDVLTECLGHSLPRPTMVRIHEISGGNPFYALELARALDEGGHFFGRTALPATLAELVQTRIGGLPAKTRTVLLAASCVPTATLTLVAHATATSTARVLSHLAPAESSGIVTVDGQQVRFTHPLLAHGVYVNASGVDRRMIHRRLADHVTEPELRARHLALAATSADSRTLQMLDVAAINASARGAPATAAELLTLAIKAGGDTPQRHIHCATMHFAAGDAAAARGELERTIPSLQSGPLRADALAALGLVRLFDDSFTDAIDLLRRALREPGLSLETTVRLGVTLALTMLNGGHAAAPETIAAAVDGAEQLRDPLLLSQALAIQTLVKFVSGDGLDRVALQRALDAEARLVDTTATPPSLRMVLSPRWQRALLLGWSGDLDTAHELFKDVSRRCTESGQEQELMYAAYYTVQIEIWRANFAEAQQIADEASRRAAQLGGAVPLCGAMTMQSALAAFAGRTSEARDGATAALRASRSIGALRLSVWPLMTLGFVCVSLDDYQGALDNLKPLLAQLDSRPDSSEIVTAWFVPDAVDALLALGRIDDAEPLVDRLERNGRRLDRPWILAAGLRCRGALLAAGGHLDAAEAAVNEALRHHSRVVMPFERARTLLLLGQLQRRQRHAPAAAATLTIASQEFDRISTPLWARRCRIELQRANVAPGVGEKLTPTEQRVAQLAARGMTNREVAASLFISSKTVEANMTRIYRKLGIHSRAELGRLLGDDGETLLPKVSD